MIPSTTLHVKPFASEADDDSEATFGDPVEWVVFGMAPGSMEEPGTTNRDLSVIAWTVYAPATDVPDRRDRVVVDGEDFEIEGRPADWTRGPWNHPTAGVVVELRRAEG